MAVIATFLALSINASSSIYILMRSYMNPSTEDSLVGNSTVSSISSPRSVSYFSSYDGSRCSFCRYPRFGGYH